VRATISNYEVGREYARFTIIYSILWRRFWIYFGVNATDPDFELNSRLIEYFKMKP